RPGPPASSNPIGASERAREVCRTSESFRRGKPTVHTSLRRGLAEEILQEVLIRGVVGYLSHGATHRQSADSPFFPVCAEPISCPARQVCRGFFPPAFLTEVRRTFPRALWRR